MTALAALDQPIRSLYDRVATYAEPLDMDAIGRALAEFAHDEEYLAHHIAKLPADRFSGRILAEPAPDLPLLNLVYRPEGVVSKVHSHSVWVAIAPINGTETHRHFRIDEKTPDGRAKLTLDEERFLEASQSDYVTMIPPQDVHEHGHSHGHGLPGHILVLTARPQTLFERVQYDIPAGTWQALPVGVMEIR